MTAPPRAAVAVTAPAAGPTGPDRRLCWGLLAASAVVFVALAAVLIPWHWVPGGHYVQVSPQEVFTPHELARSRSYAWPQRLVSWAELLVSLVVALALAFTPAGRALVGRRNRLLGGPWWWRVLAATFLVLLVGALAALPFDWVLHRRAVRFGLSVEHPAAWLQDEATSFLVTFVGTAIGLLVLVAIVRRAPRTWPLWAAVAVVVLAFAGSFAYPVVVEPLFNSFTPMKAGPLRTDILALAKKEHVHISDVLVADESRRTTALNAYVTGFGSTRRVVVYDTMIEQLPRREVEVVIAHELGHAHHDDVLHGTILGAAGAVFGVALLGLLTTGRRRPAPLLRRARLESLGDPRSVPFVLALVAVGTLLASPVENTMSRAIEARADRASLAATNDYDAFTQMQVALAVSSLSEADPPWLSQFWFGTHPTTLQRIGIARALEEQVRRTVPVR